MPMSLAQQWITTIVGALILGIIFGWILYKLATARNKKRIIKESIKSLDPEAKVVVGGKKFENKDVDMYLDGKKCGMDGKPKAYKDVNEFVKDMKKQPLIENKTVVVDERKQENRVRVPSKKELQGRTKK